MTRVFGNWDSAKWGITHAKPARAANLVSFSAFGPRVCNDLPPGLLRQGLSFNLFPDDL